jgi:hypothetical protein
MLSTAAERSTTNWEEGGRNAGMDYADYTDKQEFLNRRETEARETFYEEGRRPGEDREFFTTEYADYTDKGRMECWSAECAVRRSEEV